MLVSPELHQALASQDVHSQGVGLFRFLSEDTLPLPLLLIRVTQTFTGLHHGSGKSPRWEKDLHLPILASDLPCPFAAAIPMPVGAEHSTRHLLNEWTYESAQPNPKTTPWLWKVRGGFLTSRKRVLVLSPDSRGSGRPREGL